uniref:Uncharacterized protein n=1 Tax=viral metagenome TaxID=1070528 RepID=A0A6M3KVT9_9ZZZZ
MRDWIHDFSRKWGIHPVTLALIVAGVGYLFLCRIFPALFMRAMEGSL